jgi:hypothetical protein
MDEWWEERTLPQKILLGIGFGLAGLGFVALMGVAVLLLWNWLMPDIFGLTTITYWQSLGLLALSWILFNRISLKDDESSKKQERRRKRELRKQMRPAETSAADETSTPKEPKSEPSEEDNESRNI